jgi:hypothetical protein
MNKLSVLYLFLSLTTISIAQQFTLRGKVVDKSTSSVLIYANIRILGTTSGTTSNMEGSYELRLKPDSYKLTASYIGYKSDTISVNLQSNKTVYFELEPIPVHMSEITVFPGENPAVAIIRKAIEAKHVRNDNLNAYEFLGYTKGLLKTTKDFSTKDNSAGLSLSEDTAKLKITGIIENVSKGFFKKPNYYKDEIIARKQSANAPSSLNIFTGGRIIQNFYNDDIQFVGRPLMSPIADDALDYYYFRIVDTLAMDKSNVFQINVEPQKKSNPGFIGTLYIADNTFALVKLELSLNDQANPGHLFTEIKILQQFSMFDCAEQQSNRFVSMPIDYRIFANLNYLGIAKVGFELNTIFHDYKINIPISDDTFGMAVVKVQPDADKKDSTFWKTTQTIPNSFEEVSAYKRIDSLEAIPKTFWDRFSFLSSSFDVNDNLSVTGPLGLYSFNRIEGHSLNFGADLYDINEKRLNSSIDLSYGFNDKKFKTDFSSKYYFGEYRTSSVSIEAYNKITSLFEESILYSKLTSTLTNLLGKYDFRDYYYTKGFKINFASEVLPVLRLGFGFFNRTDNNGFVNSDFSFFNRDKIYNYNKLIYETKINAATAEFKLDFRKFIEDGFFRRRLSQRNFNITLNGDVTLSNNSLLKSSIDFQLYKISLNGYLTNYKSAGMNFILSGSYSNGPVPYQMLDALPGNIESGSQTFTIRTLRMGEVFGDRTLTLSVEQNFNDEIFRLFGLTFLCDMQLMLYTHFNAALIEISPKSFAILPEKLNNPAFQNITEFKHPFYELGFGIGHPLFPFRIEFTWKLNYFGNNNFVIGLNSALF